MSLGPMGMNTGMDINSMVSKRYSLCFRLLDLPRNGALYLLQNLAKHEVFGGLDRLLDPLL